MVLVPCYYCHCILWNLHVCMSGWVVPPEHICACIQENHRQKCRLIRLGLSELRIRGGATGTQVYDEDTFDFTFHNTCSPLQIEIFYFSTLQSHMIEVNIGSLQSSFTVCLFVYLILFESSTHVFTCIHHLKYVQIQFRPHINFYVNASCIVLFTLTAFLFWKSPNFFHELLQ